ncbi:S-adenosyl-L-methionine-dependent methyltransferase [Cantharellus anzutake]|uniref:S-adenosyl-L-methionine-dependent methyltransferase n=1 Tax=Cantharellus anzutake TaxID=1750568 RepID=UPI0019081C75|nr:S-adenosyl-L-methionine-dependent methyltransferase [Cantharellus anzutake]KAF8325155.1 S-adenosyl-L-methionine-dependent methyltransferase [Cantharellus anzutake]
MGRIFSPSSLLGVSSAWLVYLYFSPLKSYVSQFTGNASLSGWIIFITTLGLLLYTFWRNIWTYMLFAWYCFIVPLGDTNDQKARLDKFYQGQAQVYDQTRSGLLRGRKTMLSMSAAHLHLLREGNPEKRLIWVDIGGGTGWNIETMDLYFPISSFDAVYLIDLCEPLLQMARRRFEAKGWTNIICLCQDATEFSLPEWSDGVHPRGSVSFVTLSYSLSMIPSYHSLLDVVDYILDPQDGLFSVVDFYTAGKEPSPHEKAIGGDSKKCGWLSRWFWQIWFDFDHVDLSPGRRNYLEYRFGTIKSFNGRNGFIIPLIVRIPYYIWLGCSRDRDPALHPRRRAQHKLVLEGEKICDGSPGSVNSSSDTLTDGQGEDAPMSLNLATTAGGVAAVGGGPPVLGVNVEESGVGMPLIGTKPKNAFYYHIASPWRMPYLESPIHSEFRTFIYSFTWEDPAKDLDYLDIGPKDTVFAITSAGDNILHYAINARPGKIHTVDMNPCQGHLLELKLASIKALSYPTFFSMFGTGFLPTFRTLLSSQISPFLSSAAFQFWSVNANAFNSSFYLRGYSGWALRIAKWLFWATGMSGEVRRICEAETLMEQDEIWRRSLRKVFVEGQFVRWLVNNPVFLWNALGVPQNQKKAFTDEGTVHDFIKDTLDPIGSHALLSRGAYHYLLCLMGCYTPQSCPDYLTRRGFDALRANDGELMNSISVHTDSIVNVLGRLDANSVTRAIIMDHLYVLSLDEEVHQFRRVLPSGGVVMWRSAAKLPWYNSVFEQAGFIVTPLGIRTGPCKAVDRVNMYASCWKAVKP